MASKILAAAGITASDAEKATGGLHYMKEEEIAERRAQVMEVIQDLLGQVRTGGLNLTNITMPVSLFEPRSFLQRICSFWGQVDLLKKAAKSTDPVDRLCHTVAFAVAGISLELPGLKPFNPVLGETFQGAFADGTELFLEQVSHHPPVSAFQVHGEGFKMSGNLSMSAGIWANSCRIYHEGQHTVTFDDGTTITWNMPVVYFRGVFFGDIYAEVFESMKFEDSVNDVTCELVFAPDAQGYLKSFFKKAKSPSDTVRGEVFIGATAMGKDKAISPGKIEGSWISHLEFAGKRIWTKADGGDMKVTQPESMQAGLLPSDSSKRMDLVHLAAGNKDGSATSKVEIEETQRRDRKLRKEWTEDRDVLCQKLEAVTVS